MEHKGRSRNIRVVLEILKNEVDGAVVSAFDKMTEDYSMTWMYSRGNKLFPSTNKKVTQEMEEAFSIKGRKYDIRNILERDNIVMVELIESYPDMETPKKYRSPLVLIFELEEGKVRKVRHYSDPQASFSYPSEKHIEEAFKGTPSKIIID